ncbi:MAG: serine hydrolase domain-containing protein [Planctomycetota bacterium]
MISLASLVLTSIAAASTGPLRIGDELIERIDALAREAIEKEGVPGLSIAVGRDGELLFARGWGYADAKQGTPASADTIYAIGSLTRQFTAVSILQLAEAGKLTLDDPLSKWLPDFPAQGHAITLRQLLSNTSGLPGYSALAAAHGSKVDCHLEREELFGLFEKVPFEFTPGAGFSFNNTGYLLLSMVVAKAGGEDFTDYVRTRLLQPLELERTRFLPHAERPTGFAEDCKELSDERELEIPMAGPSAGSTQSLGSSAKDLFRWQSALNDRQLIGEASTTLMRTPARLADGTPTGHGFATAIEETDFAQVLSHTGGIGGFRVRLAHSVEPRLTVVVLANCSTAPVERLEQAITRAALGLLPAQTADLPVAPEEVAALVGSYQIATQRVSVFEKESKIWFEYPGQPAFALLRQGRRAFVSSIDPNWRITFQGDGDGPATSFEIVREGLVSVGKRME